MGLLSTLDPPNGRRTLAGTLETGNRVGGNRESVGVTSGYPCSSTHIVVTAWAHKTRRDDTHVVLYTISQL